MFSMVHSDVIRVWVYVPQDDAFGVSPGVEAVIRVPTMPNLTFHGTVTRIADALQPGTRTLLTEVDVPNPDGALQPGVYCTVELKIPRKSPALIVPASAIIFNQNGMQVAVAENRLWHRGPGQRGRQGRRQGHPAAAGQLGRWRQSADHPRASYGHTVAMSTRLRTAPGIAVIQQTMKSDEANYRTLLG
jgi:multidrug efflux pump subunit AcrA (membrane-fusion protein)